METNEILRLFDQQLRIDIEYPGTRKEVLPNVVRFIRPAPGANLILYSRVDETNVDAVIRDQIDYFVPLNQPFGWKVYGHDYPPVLKERLVAAGFEEEEPDAVMILDLEQVSSEMLQPIQGDTRLLTHRDQIEDVIRVEEQVWGGNFGWMRQRLGDHMQIPGYISIYVTYRENEPTCAGWTYYHPGSVFADLWGGSTVPAYRQRGFYTQVLMARIQEAVRRGVRFLTIDTSPMSRPIVEKNGFQLLTLAHNFDWRFSDETTA